MINKNKFRINKLAADQMKIADRIMDMASIGDLELEPSMELLKIAHEMIWIRDRIKKIGDGIE